MILARGKNNWRKRKPILLIFAFAIGILHTHAQTFVGEILYRDAYQYVKLNCREDTCTFSMPYLDGRATYQTLVDLKSVKTWKVKRGIEMWKFNSKKTEEGLQGEVHLPSGKRELLLYEQKSPVDKTKLADYTGSYRNSEGQVAVVYDRFDFLHLMSPLSEKTVGLKTISDERFWNVSGETIRFENYDDPSYSTLVITDRKGNRHRFSKQPAIEVMSVRPVIDTDTLHGEIYKPQGSGPFSAILILPGGGNRSQIDNFRFEARYFAALGMVTMVFDKPGVGQSTGLNFDGLTFLEKAATYEQVFDYLAAFDFVDQNKLGVHGSSEGGRLSLMMAINRPSNVAFVNAVAAPIMTMREGQLYALDHYHRNLGLPEETILETREIWNHYYGGIIADTITPKNSTRIAELQAEYQRIFLPPSATELPLSPNKFDLQDDAVARKSSAIQCPVFLQYGENDQRVHGNASIRNFYAHGINTDLVDVQIYPRGGHSMMTPEYMICPGYMADKRKWLKMVEVIQ